jgi:hypothetical protein
MNYWDRSVDPLVRLSRQFSAPRSLNGLKLAPAFPFLCFRARMTTDQGRPKPLGKRRAWEGPGAAK